jgi:hypothetical protein
MNENRKKKRNIFQIKELAFHRRTGFDKKNQLSVAQKCRKLERTKKKKKMTKEKCKFKFFFLVD